jgi:tetratricopeptide (TPR) repeat protein
MDFNLFFAVCSSEQTLRNRRRWLSVLVVAGAVTCSGAAFGFAQSRDASAPGLSSTDTMRLTQAMDAMDGGDLSKAKNLLEALHARIAGNFEIDESLGLVYARQGRLEKAEPLLAAGVHERPQYDVAHVNLGTAYFKLRHLDRAAQEFERAVQLNPANGQAQDSLGQTWMLLKQPGKAAIAFEAALQQDPANPDLLYNAALAQFDNGQPARAAALLARMPGVALSAPAQSLYGDTEEKLGHYKQAAEHYAAAVRLDPSEANVYVLGVEFLRHWTFGPAIEEFAAGVKQYPESQRMKRGLGIAYYGDGNYDQAIPIFAGLLAADPKNALDARLFGRACTVLTEGLNPKCAYLIEFAKQHPRNAVLATYAASSILHKPSDAKGLAMASMFLQSAIATDPTFSEAQLEMGALLQTESKWDESIRPLQAAVRLQPDSAQAHYRLARAYSHTGRHAEAQQQIALYQRYSQQQETSLDSRMKEITTLVVKMQ